MNITSTRINHRVKPQVQATPKQDSTFSGAKDGFAKATQTVIDHPMRSITNVVSVGTMAGGLATMGSNSANGQFMAGTGIVLGAVHSLAAVVRGIDALSSMPYGTQLGKPSKNQALSALGDVLSASGHFALQAGVTTPAAALVIGGALVSSAFDYSS
jgi:hypothetical protein